MFAAAWACASPEQASTQLFPHGSQSRHGLFSETWFQDLSQNPVGKYQSREWHPQCRWHSIQMEGSCSPFPLAVGSEDQPVFRYLVPICIIFISFT